MAASLVRKGEDRLVVDKEQGLYGVFDGHMGAQASVFACHFFPKAFKRYRSSPDSEESLKAALTMALAETESELIKEMGELDVGTTACVAVVSQDLVVVANIGDSRAIVYTPRASGKLLARKLSQEHHPHELGEKQRILAAGGMVDGNRMLTPDGMSLAVSRALGDKKFKRFGLSSEPELRVWRRQGDMRSCYLLLATDGLFDRISDVKLGFELVGDDEQTIANKVVEMARGLDREKMLSVITPVPASFEGHVPAPVEGGDDLSLVLVRV